MKKLQTTRQVIEMIQKHLFPTNEIEKESAVWRTWETGYNQAISSILSKLEESK